MVLGILASWDLLVPSFQGTPWIVFLGKRMDGVVSLRRRIMLHLQGRLWADTGARMEQPADVMTCNRRLVMQLTPVVARVTSVSARVGGSR